MPTPFEHLLANILQPYTLNPKPRGKTKSKDGTRNT